MGGFTVDLLVISTDASDKQHTELNRSHRPANNTVSKLSRTKWFRAINVDVNQNM